MWSVLSDASQWPSWVESIEAVAAEDVATTEGAAVDVGVVDDAVPLTASADKAYRIEQPPLPSAVWSVTRWEAGTGFEWQSRGVTTLVSERYDLSEASEGTTVTIDVTWSGRSAWFARAAYGPVRQRYAVAQLEALARVCFDAQSGG